MTKPAKKTAHKQFDYKYDLVGLALIGCAFIGLAGIFTDAIGTVGLLIKEGLGILAGNGYTLLLALLFLSGIKLMRRDKWQINSQFYGLLLLFGSLQIFLHRHIPLDSSLQAALDGQGGGLIGASLGYAFVYSFGIVGTYILLFFLTLLGIALCYGTSPKGLIIGCWTGMKSKITMLWRFISNFLFDEVEDTSTTTRKKNKNKPTPIDSCPPPENTREDSQESPTIAIAPVALTSHGLEANPTPDDTLPRGNDTSANLKDYHLPPLALLNPPPKQVEGTASQDINHKIKTLEQTLDNFGIKARVTHVSVGPAITRYELQPPPGVKVSKIVGLSDDIALGMATMGVRIEAPIPGKAAVGIEVPNNEIAAVSLRELLETKPFSQATSQLTVALGKDIAGTPVLADLAKMPHLLIAGATGSGKSVCVNTLICSILFKATPDEVKFLLVDPKMVELANYNDIPHLVSPVVTDAKKAAGALRWAVREMESRYDLFATAGVRDITRYNDMLEELTDQPEQAPLPLIVVIIDELADLMMVAPADVEDSICRLAQMARAAGIHLVVATQRPSVDVITGLIKANIPSRISFAVSSQMDSRTILDMGGAEKLLGKGDMLFYPVGTAKPLRVQGAYLSDREVENLVDFLKDQARPEYNEEVCLDLPDEQAPEIEETDELLPQAIKIFIESGTASISMLQRRLRIGYSRAARLVDIMERRGIVGGFEGSKPRAVLMTMEQYQQMFEKKDETKTEEPKTAVS